MGAVALLPLMFFCIINKFLLVRTLIKELRAITVVEVVTALRMLRNASLIAAVKTTGHFRFTFCILL